MLEKVFRNKKFIGYILLQARNWRWCFHRHFKWQSRKTIWKFKSSKSGTVVSEKRNSVVHAKLSSTNLKTILIGTPCTFWQTFTYKGHQNNFLQPYRTRPLVSPTAKALPTSLGRQDRTRQDISPNPAKCPMLQEAAHVVSTALSNKQVHSCRHEFLGCYVI